MQAFSDGAVRPGILVIVGTRPEAIKLAPVILALVAQKLPPRVCVTGQHPVLAAEALAAFGIAADLTLSLQRRSQSLAALNDSLIVELAALFTLERPRWTIVQGDTSSAVGAAISAHRAGIPVAHVEAGLRSFDTSSPFPEEINRTLIARLAHLHFAPTCGARRNLLAEGVAASRIEITGNTVVDALHWIRRHAGARGAQRTLTGKRLVLATLHRRENRGEPLRNVVAALVGLASRADVEIAVPLHPGSETAAFEPLRRAGGRLLTPLPYADFIGLAARSHLIITDSGGLQEEASALGIPTLIVRANTERPEVVEAGTACIVGTHTALIANAAARLLDDAGAHRRMAMASTRLGDGKAAQRIAGRMQRALRSRPARPA